MRSKAGLKSIICAAIVLFGTGYARAGTWTTLNVPGAEFTRVHGIDGSNIVGDYFDGSTYHGFLYNGTTWTTLDMPGATDWRGTGAWDIDGGNIVGGSGDHGFIYDGTTWTTLDIPGATYTWVRGISGNNLIGSNGDLPNFIYDGTTWTTLNAPGAEFTRVHGIDGSNIVGDYFDGSTYHGFLYNGTTWTTLDMPGATVEFGTGAYGIDGSNIVGASGDRGFLYDGTTYTTLEMPGATTTWAWAISGTNIIGQYNDASGMHSFLYTIPEPATLLLLGLGAVIVKRKRS